MVFYFMWYNETLYQVVHGYLKKMLRLERDFVSGRVLGISGNEKSNLTIALFKIGIKSIEQLFSSL